MEGTEAGTYEAMISELRRVANANEQSLHQRLDAVMHERDALRIIVGNVETLLAGLEAKPKPTPVAGYSAPTVISLDDLRAALERP